MKNTPLGAMANLRKQRRRKWSSDSSGTTPEKKPAAKPSNLKPPTKKKKHGKPPPCWQDLCQDYMLEFFEERAAIHQYEAGLSKERSEFIAYHAMLRKYWGPKR